MALHKVDFLGLRYDHRHKSPVLFLKDVEREKYLPVWIGELEANSIELAVIRKAAPRPLTHDLVSIILGNLEARISKVVIDRLEDRTYYAELHLYHEGDVKVIDCRPSDAVAIALRENSEIFVDDELMYSIKFVEIEEAGLDGDDVPPVVEAVEERVETDDEGFKDFLNRISPTDFKEG